MCLLLKTCRNPEGADDLRPFAEQNRDRCMICRVDLEDPNSMQHARGQIRDWLKGIPLDVLFQNASQVRSLFEPQV